MQKLFFKIRHAYDWIFSNDQIASVQDDAAVLNFFAETSSESPEEQAKEFLSNETFFGPDLCKVQGLVESVGASLREILDKGMRTVMNEKFGV